MAANTLSEVMKTVQDGEDGDAAYRRLYGHQTRPCDFRRWFSAVQQNKACQEISEELNTQIAGYIQEGMLVEEAFRQHCPDFVGPGEFSVAYDKELNSRKSDQKPTPVKHKPHFQFVPKTVANQATRSVSEANVADEPDADLPNE